MTKPTLLIVSFLATVACGYAPSPPSGTQACDLTGSHPCPDGYICGARNMCWTSGSGSGGTGGTAASTSGGTGGEAGTSTGTCNLDSWIASKQADAIAMPTSCASKTSGTGTATADLPSTLFAGAPTSLTISYSLNATLTAVNGVSCTPVSPGKILSFENASCGQYYYCGCCGFFVRWYGGATGGEKWSIDNLGYNTPGGACSFSKNKGDAYSFEKK